MEYLKTATIIQCTIFSFQFLMNKKQSSNPFFKVGQKRKSISKIQICFSMSCENKKMEMELEFHFPMPSKNSWHYKGTCILVTFYLSMSNFCLLCSWLTVKFLSFGYSCNIQGFWYFARSQSCKIQVNPQNPTKFTNTHSKCHKIWQKSYRIHVCTTYLKLMSAIGAIYLP